MNSKFILLILTFSFALVLLVLTDFSILWWLFMFLSGAAFTTVSLLSVVVFFISADQKQTLVLDEPKSTKLG